MLLVSKTGYDDRTGAYELCDLETVDIENDLLHSEVMQYEFAVAWLASCVDRLLYILEDELSPDFLDEIHASLDLADKLVIPVHEDDNGE